MTTLIVTNPALRRAQRVRAKLKTNITLPRLSVFRSNQHLWVQIIDDRKSITLVSASTKNLKTTGTKTEKALALGKVIAKAAIDKHITQVRFDRGAYKYHGRVKALATGAREAGLKF